MTTGLRPSRCNSCRDQARDRALAASRSHRAHRNDGDHRLELRAPGSQKPEIGVRCHGTGSEMHQVLVGNVAVGKHHNINLVFGDQLLQIVLFENRNAFGIQALLQVPPDTGARQCQESEWQ